MKTNLVTEAKKLLNQLEPPPPTLVMVLGRKNGEVIIRYATLTSGYPEDLVIKISRTDEDKAFFDAYDPTALMEQTRKNLDI